MNKLVTLLKASMFDNWTLFKVKTKKQIKFTEKILPVALTSVCFLLNGTLAKIIIEPLQKENLGIVLLTLFILYTSVMTLIEGIYKSGSLLFNCKDDNLLLSLPIKKSTILFVRIFKFYLFEVLYNSLFLIPAMVIYAVYSNVGPTYYLVSFIALLILPIVPVIISCIIGATISIYASRFKFKSFAEIVVTAGSLLVIFYISMNFNSVLGDLVQKASSINDTIVRLYYPAGEYIKLVMNFNIIDLLTYICINVGILLAIVLGFSKIYFYINSKVKIIKTGARSKNYEIKTNTQLVSLIKKEFRRFISSPVAVTNSCFGLALFIIGCIMISANFENVAGVIVTQDIAISVEKIRNYMPVILFGFICLTALMTSITSSMISLEGKAFNILKSFPVKPFKVIMSKILTAMIIMLPFIIIGNIIIIAKFTFSIFETLLIIATSIVMPLLAETMGIIVNLKYPRLDAENDTQVVKQSVSSMIAVFMGLILTAITVFALILCINNNVSKDLIMIIGLSVYSAFCAVLIIYLRKESVKDFIKLNS